VEVFSVKIERFKLITGSAALACLLLCAAGFLFGQGHPMGQPQPNMPGTSPDQSGPDNGQLAPASTMSDADFAKDAAQGGMAEVKLGQLAQDKGSSDAVKDFGKRMVDDHSAANLKLKEIASQENVKLPTDLSKHDKEVYSKLSQLSGDEFDRAYARDMVKDHQQDIAEFQQEAANGQDGAIKNFASETLPTLQDHLKMARQMVKTVGTSGSSASKPGGSY
jgi:putative membrane protein